MILHEKAHYIYYGIVGMIGNTVINWQYEAYQLIGASVKGFVNGGFAVVGGVAFAYIIKKIKKYWNEKNI